jgi:cytochrome c-type biogenesis protein CcmH/NrfF
MRRRALPIGGRWTYGLLALVVICALVVGSRHHATPSKAERVANLESIIKCPDCADLTIAQSSSAAAEGLRQRVVAMVDAGRSDATIEQYVVEQYGPQEIISPHGGSGAVVIGLPIAAFLLAAATLAVRFTRRRGGGRAAVADADQALVAAALADRRGSS